VIFRPHRLAPLGASILCTMFAMTALAVALPRPALAQTFEASPGPRSRLTFSFVPRDPDGGVLRLGLTRQIALDAGLAPAASRSSGQARPTVVQYSDAYQLRARIHRTASLVSLPLFVAEGLVGESLYRNPTPGKRGAHLALAAGIGGLFAINTVTGVWNLIEARKDPTDRGRRVLHGVLMLAADAGFLATAALAPEGEEGRRIGPSPRRGAHRAMAFTSIGLATAGYLVMLVGGR
jgi:hypothetical protein